jgi:inosine-uridine nucleoside N-ribohydrolase
MRRIAIPTSALALLTVACGTNAVTTTTAGSTTVIDVETTVVDTRTPVIFDYSPTVSDVGALVFLASHPELRLLAVTLPGTGESHCEPGVVHTRGALEALGLGDVPVACGPTVGTGSLNPFPEEWRDRSDTIDLPEAAPNETRSAPDLIADLIAASATPIQIVAVGPLTNLAAVLSDNPEIAASIAGITIMGGAVDVPGNVPPVSGWELANAYAEVNFWVDPTAAALVIQSGVPVTLIPLDATNSVPVDHAFYRELTAAPTTPASELLAGVWEQAPEWLTDDYYLWDELAAAVLTDESLVRFETRDLLVEDGDPSVTGWSREDPAGVAVRVAVSANRSAFERLFLETLLGRVVNIERSAATAEEVAYFEAVEQIVATYDAALDVVFQEAATDLGFGEDNESMTEEEAEQAWLQVLVAAAPAALDGPLPDLAFSLEAVAAPPGLSELHIAWLDAIRNWLDHSTEFLVALETTVASNLTEPLPYLSQFEESCAALQVAGTERGLTVDLNC